MKTIPYRFHWKHEKGEGISWVVGKQRRGFKCHLHRPVQYLITIGIATGVAFVLSWIFGIREEEPAAQPNQAVEQAPASAQLAAGQGEDAV